jgi:hypothetical protein
MTDSERQFKTINHRDTMTEETITFETDFSAFGWFLDLSSSDYHVDFKLWEITGFDPQEKLPMFGQDMESIETDRDKVQPDIRGTVKFDGCSHVYFGPEEDEPGYMHLCGEPAWKDTIAALERVFKECMKRLAT